MTFSALRFSGSSGLQLSERPVEEGLGLAALRLNLGTECSQPLRIATQLVQAPNSGLTNPRFEARRPLRSSPIAGIQSDAANAMAFVQTGSHADIEAVPFHRFTVKLSHYRTAPMTVGGALVQCKFLLHLVMETQQSLGECG